MRKPGPITSVSALLILTGAVYAEQLQVRVIGQVIEKTCADFLVASSDINAGGFISANLADKGNRLVSDNQEYVQWAFGFISGVNNVIAYSLPRNVHQIERLSAPEIDLRLRNYCNKNPSSRFIDAVQAFTKNETGG
jgi:hypothetical protein